MAYCTTADLLLGNIPTPSGLSVQKVVDDASDEIDSKIGMRYETPVDIATASPPNPVVRPVKLLLKRLNVFLATGRLILAVTSNGEDDRLHAYGLSLVNEANAALDQIADGAYILEGVPVSASYTPTVSTPLINNLDPESNVEAFYDRIANPSYAYYGTEMMPGYSRYGNEQGMVR